MNAGDENTKGSQFVWIPVGDVKTDKSGSITTITLGRYTFDNNGTEHLVQSAENKEYRNETILKITSTTSYYYQELLNTTPSSNSKAKDIEDFVTKALSSGGYYIGRYELGDATATKSQHTNSGITNSVTCKAGVYPYTYITQSQASNLCQGMYRSSNFESDLINSYAWDTAIVFIQEFSGDTDYSQQARLQSILAKCGEATEGIINDVKCNIYDMAGNTSEWTTETYSDTSYPCVHRGGSYDYGDSYTSYRDVYDMAFNNEFHSCRPTLYL